MAFTKQNNVKVLLDGIGDKGQSTNAITGYFLTDPELNSWFGNPQNLKLTTYGTLSLSFEDLAQVFLDVKHHSSMLCLMGLATQGTSLILVHDTLT